MMSLGQDVSKCVFVYFGVISQSKMMIKSQPEKKIMRAPHTPKCLAQWCLLILTMYLISNFG